MKWENSSLSVCPSLQVWCLFCVHYLQPYICIMYQSVMQKDWIATFEVKITASVLLLQKELFAPYVMKYWTFCNWTVCDCTLAPAGVACKKVGLLSSVLKSQQRFRSLNITVCSISSELFATKHGEVMNNFIWKVWNLFSTWRSKWGFTFCILIVLWHAM